MSVPSEPSGQTPVREQPYCRVHTGRRPTTRSHILTEHVVSQDARVRRPVDVFAVGSVSDQLTAVWNVPLNKDMLLHSTIKYSAAQ